jgi:signal transduction histidine kinase
MSQEVARLERLVAEQLELARLDAGALVLDREPVDLGELAAEIAASRRLLAEREGISLVAAPTAAPVVVDADAARVEQILLILLDNAIRHTPRGGKISLGVSTDGRNGTISVRDTGTGIPIEAQQFVFDRFYQADPSREGQGLGLGLAIARGLADAHGGSIEVRSAPLVGTVFTVRLPLADRAREAPAPEGSGVGATP